MSRHASGRQRARCTYASEENEGEGHADWSPTFYIKSGDEEDEEEKKKTCAYAYIHFEYFMDTLFEVERRHDAEVNCLPHVDNLRVCHV